MGCWKKIQSQSQVALVGYLGYYGAWDSYYTSPNSHFTISTDKLLCVRVGKVSSCFRPVFVCPCTTPKTCRRQKVKREPRVPYLLLKIA